MYVIVIIVFFLPKGYRWTENVFFFFFFEVENCAGGQESKRNWTPLELSAGRF